MTKMAILGGSFDPVHRGHLFLLHQAVIKTNLKKIIIVPDHINNFKRKLLTGATNVQRLEMVRLAISEYSDIYPDDRKIEISIDDCELKRKGISYTFDTVVDIKKRYNIDGRVGIIFGDDIVPSLNEWYKAEEFFDIAEFFICRRLVAEPDYSHLSDKAVYNKLPLDGKIYEGSSTGFKKDGIDILTPKVKNYVRKNNLYRKTVK